MIRHVVLFKLKESVSKEEKLRVANDFKKAIEALKGVIDEIVDIEVGININEAESWEIALNSTFKTLDDVKKYATHKAHVEAAKILADYKENRACVDYHL